MHESRTSEVHQRFYRELCTTLDAMTRNAALTDAEVVCLVAMYCGRLIGTLPSPTHKTLLEMARSNLLRGLLEMQTGRYKDFGAFIRKEK